MLKMCCAVVLEMAWNFANQMFLDDKPLRKSWEIWKTTNEGYLCAVCFSTFTSADSLRKHMKNHEKKGEPMSLDSQRLLKAFAFESQNTASSQLRQMEYGRIRMMFGSATVHVPDNPHGDVDERATTSAVSGQILELTVESCGDISSEVTKAEIPGRPSNNDKDDRLRGMECYPGKSSMASRDGKLSARVQSRPLWGERPTVTGMWC